MAWEFELYGEHQAEFVFEVQLHGVPGFDDTMGDHRDMGSKIPINIIMPNNIDLVLNYPFQPS
jgi:hypothetical protein